MLPGKIEAIVIGGDCRRVVFAQFARKVARPSEIAVVIEGLKVPPRDLTGLRIRHRCRVEPLRIGCEHGAHGTAQHFGQGASTGPAVLLEGRRRSRVDRVALVDEVETRGIGVQYAGHPVYRQTPELLPIGINRRSVQLLRSRE